MIPPQSTLVNQWLYWAYLKSMVWRIIHRNLEDPQTAASLPGLTSSWLTTPKKLHHRVLFLTNLLLPVCSCFPCYHLRLKSGGGQERIVVAIPSEGLFAPSLLGRVSVSITINLIPPVLFYLTHWWWSCYAQKKRPYYNNHTTNILEDELEKKDGGRGAKKRRDIRGARAGRESQRWWDL